MMGPSGNGSEAFRTYFANREPRDEEIMGLLAVSAMANGEFPAGDGFSALVEALAALSPATRAKICREFCRELKNLRRQMAPA